MEISTVIGNTVTDNRLIAKSPNGEVAYAAGAVVVIYDLRRETQTKYLHGHSSKPITCLDFSPNGRYLAVGESGRDPQVTIYDTVTGDISSQLASFHSHGI